MFEQPIEPKFKRNPISLEEAKTHLKDWNEAAIEYLDRLDWDKTAIFYEKERSTGRRSIGIRVIHFKTKVEEKWHNVWGQTWISISFMMS